MRNIVLTHPLTNRPRHTVVTADFVYCDGTVARQRVERSTPAAALAASLRWARRCMDPVQVAESRKQHEAFMRDIAVWGCE